MAKVRLNLREKSDSELLTFSQQHETAMTGNANFTSPLPTAAAFTPVLSGYDTALANSNTAQQAAKQATTVKDTSRAALEAILAARANYVELIANQAADPAAVIESAGFGVKASGSATTPPPTVMNLNITAGDDSGELDLQWDPVPRAKTYDIEVSPEPMTPTSWIAKPSTTRSRASVNGLTSGARVWVRVRAVSAGGTGPWSDPATKIVP